MVKRFFSKAKLYKFQFIVHFENERERETGLAGPWKESSKSEAGEVKRLRLELARFDDDGHLH